MTAPLRRRGPRPLPLHLGLAGMRALAATQSLGVLPAPGPAGTPWPSGLPNWSGAWPISKAGQVEQARILGDLAASGHPPEALAGAVLRRVLRADRALVAGIAAYRRHPWFRAMPEAPVLWAEGGTRLLDFGGDGPPVLFVPSLVNRAHVLDLTPEASLMRWLPGQGFRTLLLDWGWPGEAERHFTLTDYVAGRLERALTAAPGPVVLAGYCMGGLLALAAALRRPDRVRALALLATPWDFHAGPDGPRRARTAAALLPGLETLMEPTGALPVDGIQTLFAMLDPFGVGQKFRAFARLPQDGARARLFRGARGLAERRRSAARARGAAVPRRLVRAERARAARLADRRAGGRPRRLGGPGLPRHPGTRPDRPAGLRPGGRRAVAGRHGARRRGRAYRHGGGGGGGSGALAALRRMAPPLVAAPRPGACCAATPPGRINQS